jgi:hypothetical protein
MFTKRMPLLSAFAGGCLSSAVVLGLWLRGNGGEPGPQELSLVPPQAALVEARSSAPDRAPVADVEPAPVADVEPAPVVAVEPSVAKPADDVAATEAIEPGSSVADVLARLEQAYREELNTLPAPELPTPASKDKAVANPQPAVANPQPAVANPQPAVANLQPAVANPQPAVANPQPVVANPQPAVANIGNVEQNVHVGNVHQGDAYQVEQVAVFQYVPQYIPFVPLVPSSRPAAPVQQSRRVMSRRTPASPTALMNPDNPWGFDFPPTVLVK